MKYLITTLIAPLLVLSLASCATKTREPQEEKAVDKESIRRGIRTMLPSVKNCYENFLARSKVLKRSGKIVMAWDIPQTGQATNITFKQDDIGNPQLQTCMTEALKKVKFPIPPHGQTAEIQAYPFVLKDHQVEAH